MRHLLWTVILVLAFFAGSCEKLSSKKSYTIDPVFREYFNFKNGSQWKYILLSDTTVTETVELQGYLNGKSVWDAFEQEFLQYDLVSDIDSSYKLRAVADEFNSVNTSLLVKDTFYRIAAQWYYFSNTFTGLSGTGDSFTYHPQYLLRGKNYADVIELIPKGSRYFKALFMARHVGIIRKDMKGGKSYVLKSWQVQ
jgi:hypothetical protein